MSTTVDAAADPPRLVRTVLVTQLAVIAAFIVVAALYVGRMLTARVGPAEMLTGAYDPKDLVPFGMHAANPFFWLYGVVTVLYLTGGLLAVPMAIYAAAVAARDGDRLSRRIRALLLVGAGTAVLLLLARFTPAGADMHRWWLD
ncbi:hypothetical protein ACFOOK_22725 [Micromonospora krabiensis]|uniref:Uncharacterized protein n=1 Tax=Micromonospora krabiensis TaxID=307121 RepID=A0A1C3N7S0_9ACTN|nr:hypothetical protein [Micromonospora krabiensis]SBV28618.1 hypothetical protein GA0070620_4165 [Micromonospora krabiensis]